VSLVRFREDDDGLGTGGFAGVARQPKKAWKIPPGTTAAGGERAHCRCLGAMAPGCNRKLIEASDSEGCDEWLGNRRGPLGQRPEQAELGVAE